MIGSIFPGFHRADERMARIAGPSGTDATEPLNATDQPHILLTAVAVRNPNDYAGAAAQDSDSGPGTQRGLVPLCRTERKPRPAGRYPRPKPLCWTDRTRP
jgi:hypothetical protein